VTNPEEPRRPWRGVISWLSLVVGGAGFLVIGLAIYCLASPVPREEWVAPESQIAHAVAAGFFFMIGAPLWTLGAVMSLAVRLAKSPLNRPEEFAFRFHVATFALMAVAAAVARIVRSA
jgi:hypothetical protein